MNGQDSSSPGCSPRPSANGRRRKFLVLSATAMELDPLQDALRRFPEFNNFDFMVCGVGPTACAASLAAHLAGRETCCAGVVLSGVGGLYPPDITQLAPEAAPPGLLAVCLAEQEILADFGLAAPHGADPFNSPELDRWRAFPLGSPLTAKAATILTVLSIPFYRGVFLTVNAATATLERGLALRDHYRGLCENMEGAAAALICRRLDLPLLEIRCISNIVEDRDVSRWRLPEAIGRQAEVMTQLLRRLS